MDVNNPLVLAAELRARADRAAPEDRADLLFLAMEYERLATASAHDARDGALKVFLPK